MSLRLNEADLLKTGEAVFEPGKLNRQITFKSAVIAPGPSGEETTYVIASPPFRKWAAFEYVSVEDKIRNGQDINQTLAKVVIRYDRNIRKTMRFLSPNGGEWQIDDVVNVAEANRWMILACTLTGDDNPAATWDRETQQWSGESTSTWQTS